jgi:chorismate dehydratase
VQASLRLGCVKYLNARPLIRGWDGPVKFDHPSALCQRLADGDLEVALVSSFEFLRNPIYTIVDGVAIASDGPVYSVFVAYTQESGLKEIELDPASATGAALLQCLMAKRGRKFVAIDSAPDNLSPVKPERARLLIGDQAIRFRQKFGNGYNYLDLGDEWRGVTGKPFVYALWLIRPEVSEAKAIAGSLRVLRAENLAHLDDVIAMEKEFDRAFCAFYYRDCLRFGFGEKEKEGLQRFQRLCATFGLLPAGKVELKVV